MAGGVASWTTFEAASADLAARIRGRFESHQHVVMATIRRDGSPRLSGMEAPIRDGHMWLGMGSASMKAADLRRDPRFSLHSAPDGFQMAAGDARIEGRAEPADADQTAAFLRAHPHELDPSVQLTLYIAMIARAVHVRVEGAELVVETWTPDRGLSERRLV